MSLIHAPELAILGTYFKKHKALANGIFTGGASIGGLIFAPIIVALFREYHYTGALLIISGLLMNICVGALLMRPPEFYTGSRNEKITEDSAMKVSDIKLNEEITINEPFNGPEEPYEQPCKETDKLHEDRMRLSRSVEFVTSSMTSPYNIDGMGDSKSAQHVHLLQRTYSVGSKDYKSQQCSDQTANVKYASLDLGKLQTVLKAISRSQTALCEPSSGLYCSSLLNHTSPEILGNNANYVEKKDVVSDLGSPPPSRMRIVSILITIFDLNLMRNPVFLMFLLLTFTAMTSHFIVPNFISTHAKEVGISNENIGVLIAVLAAVGLFSRIFIGIVIDRKWLRWSTAIALMSFITGTACHLLTYVNDFPALIVYVVVVGKLNLCIQNSPKVGLYLLTD